MDLVTTIATVNMTLCGGGTLCYVLGILPWYKLCGVLAIVSALYLVVNMVMGNRILTIFDAVMFGLYTYWWWKGGGDDDSRRLGRRALGVFKGVRRTAPAPV